MSGFFNCKLELTLLFSMSSACCEKLPTSGTVSKQQAKSMKAAARVWYQNYVAQATEANWKFYIFSLIFNDVFETYCDKVSGSSSREVLRRSTISWLEDHCDLPQLRKRTFLSCFPFFSMEYFMKHHFTLILR